MPGRASEITQMAAMTKVMEVASRADEIREHCHEITTSLTFKGSRRSQDFLLHIIGKALEGHFDELKERTLGVDLFGRPVSYDTGQDAIVRVTASDVRRRLVQYYAEAGANSRFRIDLPSGSYIPEVRCLPAAIPVPPPILLPVEPVVQPPEPSRSRRSVLFYAGIMLAMGTTALGGALWYGASRKAPALPITSGGLPWSTLFQRDHQIQMILCDPDISAVQHLLDFNITLSDYANQRYVPSIAPRGTDTTRILGLFRGVNVASVDVAIAMNISEFALKQSQHVKTHTARSIRLADFKTDDDFILLGSPRSNPWSSLFNDQLDFQFVYDQNRKREVIQNKRPLTGEALLYTPTAQGWGTGDAYAIMAFVANPNQNGHVLLLAGSNAEATEAVGQLAANPELLARRLKAQKIDSTGQFELLLRVRIMAGSPSAFEVLGAHALSSKPMR